MFKSLFSKFLVATMIIVILIASQGIVSFILFQENDKLEEQIIAAHNLQNFLIQVEVDHHLWMIKLYDMFAGGPIPQTVNSHLECNLGKWYADYDPPEYAMTFYQELGEPHQIVHNSSKDVVELFKAGKEEEAKALFRKETLPAVELVRENLHNISDAEDTHVHELDRQMANLDKRITSILLISSILCFIFSIIISIVLTRIITNPIGQIVTIAEQVAGGNLTNTVSIKNKDELGRLAEAFNVMIERLRSMVINILKESAQVVNASNQLKASSDETSKAVEEIATSMIQLAEGNEDTTKQVTLLDNIFSDLQDGGVKLVENVTSTYNIAKDSENAALKGQQAISKATAQLDTVTETVNFATGAIEKLRKRSAQIGDMVKLIDGLASQTNLLALNAAIEAARAGQNGHGFAVVAEEIRSLAVESAEAAKSITSLIEDIESETTVTINSMDVNIQEVGKQVSIIRETGSFLIDIVDMSQKTRELVGSIQEFSQRLQDKTNSMGEAVTSIAGVVEENAASSQQISAFTEELSASIEEVAASADELDYMAQNLEVMVKEFKIKEG